MNRRAWIFLVARAAFGQLGPAHVGYVVDPANCLRRVFGVAGAFTVGPVLEESVLSAAYSGSSLVVKKTDVLVVDGKSLPAPAGPAIVNFDGSGRVREVFFPDAGEAWTWRNGHFEPHSAAGIVSDFAVEGDQVVLSGVPIRLPHAIRNVSRMGDNWYVAYCESSWYALGNGRAWELPEARDEAREPAPQTEVQE